MANLENLKKCVLLDYKNDRKYHKKVLKSSETTAEQKAYALKRIREDDYWIEKIKSAKPEE